MMELTQQIYEGTYYQYVGQIRWKYRFSSYKKIRLNGIYKTPSEKLTTSGVFMSGFFEGFPL